MSSYSTLFGGSSVPVGAIIQGQFASDSNYLPCDGGNYTSSLYPQLDKTSLATFGSNSAVSRTVLSQSWGWSAYGNGTFVVIPNGGAITSASFTSSTDGITWTTRTVVSKNWAGILYAAGLFVAWATDGTVVTSPDGITWTTRTGVGTLNNYAHGAYGNGMFVLIPAASVAGNTFYTSPDGITWTTRTSLPSSSYMTKGISFASGKFWITTDNTGIVFVSTDGITWSTYNNITADSNLAYKYFNVGNVLYSGAGAKSYDGGMTWVTDSSVTGSYFGYGGFLFSQNGSVKYESSSTFANLPGVLSGWFQFCGCVGANKLIIPTGTSVLTLNFDTTQFRTPFAIKVSETDRYFIRAK